MPDREKVIQDLRYLISFGGASQQSMVMQIASDALSLLKEQEAKERKWLRNISDNQLAIGGVDPLTEYEQGKRDGLQMAFEILTEGR